MSPEHTGNAVVGFLVLGPFIIGFWVIMFVGVRSFVRRFW